MWKAALRLSQVAVPVKPYAAAQDRGVHFRLLHAKDHVPVKQRMVDSKTGEEVASGDVRRALEVEKNVFVLLEPDDLAIEDPNPERIIEVTHVVPRDAIDLGWYARPYYLDPDGSSDDFFALAEALAASERSGVARWTMRGKSYFGALEARDGYLMLVTLHPADEVVPLRALERPAGSELSAGERKLAEQLVAALDSPFDPGALRDEYRERLLAFVESKAKGKKRFRVEEAPPPRAARDLSRALERSIKAAKAKTTAKEKEKKVA
jgi:DNA end-binding protein Ku